jgi:hypothetical protein
MVPVAGRSGKARASLGHPESSARRPVTASQKSAKANGKT